MHLRHHHDDDVALITDAEPSQDDQLAYRRRRYTITMSIRAACLILAACFYQLPWLAISFAALAVVLPWIAVIMANDRLPKKTEDRHRFDGARRRSLPDGGRDATRVIDQ